MPRERLPDRRPSVTLGLSWHGHAFAVTAGYSPDGHICEVFASGTRTGSDMQRMIDDACVVISLALQFGALPGDLRRSLGSVPDPVAGMAETPASVIGAILNAIADVEAPVA